MRRLERSFAKSLGEDVVLAFARVPLAPAELTRGERAELARVGSGDRDAEWLRGRAALRSALARRGEAPDTSGIRFPNARYSLSHSGGQAVAASALARGTGVDFECFRPIRAGTARFFLTEDECALVASLPSGSRSAALLRLWTVKEALFKADVDNAERTMRDYRLCDPAATAGFARTPDSAPQRYATRRTDAGVLTVAVTTGEAPC